MVEKNPFSISEEELIKRIQQGDKVAFAELYRVYFPVLCDFCFRFLANKAICEELVQDVFFNLWKNRKQWSPAIQTRSYLYKAVKNRALDHLKHLETERKYLRLYKDEQERYNPTHHEDDSAFPQEEKRETEKLISLVNQAIAELPDRRKTIFLLSREDGLTYQEIADVMDISVKTVENQMGQALVFFKKRLSKYLGLLLMLGSGF